MTYKFCENYVKEKEDRLNDFDLKWPKFKALIPTKENSTIVDFGCDKGEILKEMLLINPNGNYIGLDISEIALEKAKIDLPKVDFKKVEDGGAFPVESDFADFVFSSEVMEHVYNTENAFHEIGRILKPGGKFLITVPHHGFIKNFLITLFTFDKHFDPVGPHVRFFSKKTLYRELKKAGLRVVRCGYYGRFWPIPHSIYILSEK